MCQPSLCVHAGSYVSYGCKISITVLCILLIFTYVPACVCYKLSSVRYVHVRVHMCSWGGEENQEKGLCGSLCRHQALAVLGN